MGAAVSNTASTTTCPRTPPPPPRYLRPLPFYLTVRAGLPVRLRARLAPETHGYFFVYIFACLLCMVSENWFSFRMQMQAASLCKYVSV